MHISRLLRPHGPTSWLRGDKRVRVSAVTPQVSTDAMNRYTAVHGTSMKNKLAQAGAKFYLEQMFCRMVVHDALAAV